MRDRVQEILSWYGSDNAGTKTNLARMLRCGKLAGTGKLVILPVDQGFEHGPARSFAPNPPGYNPHYHFQLAIDAGQKLGRAIQQPVFFPSQVTISNKEALPLLPLRPDRETIHIVREWGYSLSSNLQGHDCV